MATTNTQPQFAPEPFTRPSMARIDPVRRWQVSLGMGQLIVLWSTIAGLMVGVFLFGVYSGREQGFKQALDDHKDLAVRLPVEKAVPVPTVTDAVSFENTAPVAPTTDTPDAVAATAPQNNPDLASIDSQIAKANEMVARLKQDQSAPAAETKDDGSVGFKGMAAATIPAVSEPPAKPGLNRIHEPTKLAALDSSIAAKESSAKKEIAKLSAPVAPAVPEIEAPAALQKEEAPVAAKLSVPLEEKKAASAGTSGFTIQVAAEKTQQSAQQIMKKLKARGFSARIEKAVVNKTSYFRVLVGPYSSRQSAADAQRKLVSAKLTRGASFIRRAG